MTMKSFLNMIDKNPDTKQTARIFLIRHGQPLQHTGKIFLGQTDIPLSETGKIEAAAAGDKLLEYGARPRRIYTSDLARAKETADIIAEKFGGLPVVPDILFREMAMGTWDGELIEDIKAKFPDEFKKRGSDLRNYRIQGGENFYDLYGRVTREFYRILSTDFFKAADSTDSLWNTDSGDLVIVAHHGVITVLLEELSKTGQGDCYIIATGSVTVCDMP